jgi:hypothetical protein
MPLVPVQVRVLRAAATDLRCRWLADLREVAAVLREPLGAVLTELLVPVAGTR